MPRLRKLKFWTVAKEETSNWDAEILAHNGIRAAFGLYLVKEGEATHLCEITPSSCALWVQNAFVMDDPEAEWEDSEGLEYENGGDSRFTYLRYVDVAKHDPRFITGPVVIDPKELDGADAWDAAQEAWGQSPDEPGILLTATFDAWQAETSAKRRAENVPPLSYRQTLPLFAAAAMKLLPGGNPTAETDSLFKQMRWL